MSALLSFQFEKSPLRVVMIDEVPWFVANDLAAVLGYRMASDMTRNLDDDERGTQIVRTPSGDQEMNIISESGLYAAVLKSRKPEARRFRKWVTADLLPTLRTTGRYEMPGRPTPPTAGQLLFEQDNARVNTALDIVREARKLFGPQSARLMWLSMGLPAPVSSEAPLLFADPIGPALQAWCATVDACTIEEAAQAVGLGAPDRSDQMRIGRLLREMGWYPSKVRRGHQTVNLFAPRFTAEMAEAA